MSLWYLFNWKEGSMRIQATYKPMLGGTEVRKRTFNIPGQTKQHVAKELVKDYITFVLHGYDIEIGKIL
jgi:hypothetical protein